MNTPFHTATSKAQRADSGRNVSMQYSLYKYFYHSDHWGSTSNVTDANGEVSQHVEYVPFGEVFIEELSSSAKLHTPYLFYGKELDEETGLSINSQSIIDDITKMVNEKLDDSVSILLSKCKSV